MAKTNKSKDFLGDRMKGYEDISRIYLTKRTPVIIRIDGRAFHTFTRGFDRPFDYLLSDTMASVSEYLVRNVSGCKLAYTQSDEISLLLVDYDTLETQPWFDNNLQKLVSVSASMATLQFNRIFEKKYEEYCNRLCRIDCTIEERQRLEDIRVAYAKALNSGATFDARAFVLPKEEVCNYFIWRQQDATRNSINMLARAYFSHKELMGKNTSQVQDMLMLDKGVNWNNVDTWFKRGLCVVREEDDSESRVRVDRNIPIFTQNRGYVNLCVGALS